MNFSFKSILQVVTPSLFVAVAMGFTSPQAEAMNGLVIHGAEMGIGHFHRKDSSVHPYAADNAWLSYALPAGLNPTKDTPTVMVENADGSETIFFTSLDELLTTAVAFAKTKNMQIAILNIEAHGMPGGMWYPKDQAQRDSSQCRSWRESAYGADDTAYKQYYTPVEAGDVSMFRAVAQQPNTGGLAPCVSTLREWKEEVLKTNLGEVLAENSEIHFISCIVGLGEAGDYFTKGVAKAVFTNGKSGKVLTSVNFGLGDWSIPEGMGFWDMINEAQLNQDNANYVSHKEDREIAQAGTIRVATSVAGVITSESLAVTDKFLAINTPIPALPVQTLTSMYQEKIELGGMSKAAAEYVRIPHTGTWMKTH